MKTKLKYDEVTVSPEMAESWLKDHENIRPLSKGTVERYTANMLRGEWQLNGECISFDLEGKLVNGQHRLRAVIAAGIPIVFSILENVESTIQDRGKNRGLSDYLARECNLDVRSAGFLATATGWLHRWDTDTLLSNGVPSEAQSKALTSPALLKAVSYVRDQFDSDEEWSLTNLLPPGMAVFLRHKITESNPTQSHAFFDELIKETNPDPNSITRVLSNRLKYYRHEKSKKHQRDICSLVINCWSLYKSGATPENPKSIKTPRKLSRKLEF